VTTGSVGVLRGFLGIDKSGGGFFESITAAAELDREASVQKAIEDRGGERGVAEHGREPPNSNE
jgi:hypothetical protein